MLPVGSIVQLREHSRGRATRSRSKHRVNLPNPVELLLAVQLVKLRASVGGHLAAQAIANLASTIFCALAMKLSFVSYVPTALRLGAGCGISMLVSVLGMRSVGLLTSESSTLQPITWQSVSLVHLRLLGHLHIISIDGKF